MRALSRGRSIEPAWRDPLGAPEQGKLPFVRRPTPVVILRNTSIAILTATLLAPSCSGERGAASATAETDTTVAATGAAPESEGAVVPATVARCGLPQPLQCGDRAYLAFFEQTAAPLVPGYRLPAPSDFKNYWTYFDSFAYQTKDDSDSTKAPYWTKGDFNSDGITDFAYILIRDADTSKALFGFVSNRDRYDVVPLDQDFDAEMALATQQRGSFTTAAGKGYWEPTPEQPATIRVEKHAIAFFMFESAASLFVWDPSGRRFRRIWMSD